MSPTLATRERRNEDGLMQRWVQDEWRAVHEFEDRYGMTTLSMIRHWLAGWHRIRVPEDDVERWIGAYCRAYGDVRAELLANLETEHEPPPRWHFAWIDGDTGKPDVPAMGGAVAKSYPRPDLDHTRTRAIAAEQVAEIEAREAPEQGQEEQDQGEREGGE